MPPSQPWTLSSASPWFDHAITRPADRSSPASQLRSFSMVTMSTVGYGDLGPSKGSDAVPELMTVAFIAVGIVVVFAQLSGVMGACTRAGLTGQPHVNWSQLARVGRDVAWGEMLPLTDHGI